MMTSYTAAERKKLDAEIAELQASGLLYSRMNDKLLDYMTYRTRRQFSAGILACGFFAGFAVNSFIHTLIDYWRN